MPKCPHISPAENYCIINSWLITYLQYNELYEVSYNLPDTGQLVPAYGVNYNIYIYISIGANSNHIENYIIGAIVLSMYKVCYTSSLRQ